MFYFRCWWEVEGNVFVIFFTKRLKHRSFLLLLRRPPEGRLTPRGKTRLPSACSETHRGAETNSDDDSRSSAVVILICQTVQEQLSVSPLDY